MPIKRWVIINFPGLYGFKYALEKSYQSTMKYFSSLRLWRLSFMSRLCKSARYSDMKSHFEFTFDQNLSVINWLF